MYAYAQELIKKGKAYVDDQSAEQIRAARGTLTAPGSPSPFRDRPAAESLDLFDRMRKGEFPDGSRVLRAKIDMASPNLNLRDPVMYRILHETHHNTGDKWCIYPMYDWAHGFEDSLEGITHSLCTLEFENHRPLYNWFIDAVNEGRTDDGSGPWGKKNPSPAADRVRQASAHQHRDEQAKTFGGWWRKRSSPAGTTPACPRSAATNAAATRLKASAPFCKHIGLNKFNSTVGINVLENFLREDLNQRANRVMAVLRPLKVVITNYPEGQSETLDAVNNPEGRIGRHPQSAVRPGALYRARRFHGNARPPSTSACSPATKCACAGPISSAAPM